MIEGAKWRRWVYFYIPLGVFVFWLLFPFYWMLVTSVRPDRELYRPWMAPNYTPFWTAHPTLVHIVDLLTETLFTRWMLNTLFIAIVSTAISLVCGVFAGYALSRLKFPFAGSLGSGIFITYLVPQTLLFIPLADIIRNFQLGDTRGTRKSHSSSGVRNGATRWKAMMYIIIPIAVPGILSAGIFAFTLSWNEFIYALVFLSSAQQKTVSVGVTSELVRGDVFYWGQLMAGALLGSIPVAFIYSFFVEYYVAGLTGSVKG